MNIKYRQLKAFALAVETGSFRAAADRLAVTQSSFSALVKELERDLGIALFERTTRSCRTTDAGGRLYDRVRSPLADLEDGYGYVQDIGRGARGQLSLAVLPSLAAGMATRHLAAFQRRHPDVRVRLRERKHAELIDAVASGDVEFGIGVLLRPVADMTFRYLLSDELVFVVPYDHPLTAMTPAWRCLEQFPYIYVGNGNADLALAAAQVRTPAAFEVEHVATALAMVRHGLGVALIASSTLAGADTTGLAVIPIRGEAAERRIGIIQKKGRTLGAASRAFIAQLLEEAGPVPVRRAPRRPAASVGAGTPDGPPPG
jgi:LysR family carnitine catabolism transcriptional activator